MSSQFTAAADESKTFSARPTTKGLSLREDGKAFILHQPDQMAYWQGRASAFTVLPVLDDNGVVCTRILLERKADNAQGIKGEISNAFILGDDGYVHEASYRLDEQGKVVYARARATVARFELSSGFYAEGSLQARLLNGETFDKVTDPDLAYAYLLGVCKERGDYEAVSGTLWYYAKVSKEGKTFPKVGGHSVLDAIMHRGMGELVGMQCGEAFDELVLHNKAVTWWGDLTARLIAANIDLDSVKVLFGKDALKAREGAKALGLYSIQGREVMA